jgi:saccharopepsin
MKRATFPFAIRTPLRISAKKGPFQDNGASPWYSPVRVGSDPSLPEMKLNFDTGARFIWVTSTECNTEACTWPGRIRFDPAASPTFTWISQDIVTIDFGPWGTMEAKVGNDIFGLTPEVSAGADFYVTTYYDGQQFIELNWDGGVGLPSGLNPDPLSSNLLLQMLNQGIITPEEAIIGFHMNPTTKIGEIEIGTFNQAAVIPESRVNIPFQPYIVGLEYIWTTALNSWLVGDVSVATNRMFCHDTGSSQFKGDPPIMMAASDEVYRQYAQLGYYPNLELSLGIREVGGQAGRFVLTENEYVTLIEAGSGQGNYTININPLPGLDNLVLVGSILMDHIYTLYRFEVGGSAGNYTLSPGTVEMYNKVGGPVIIQD